MALCTHLNVEVSQVTFQKWNSMGKVLDSLYFKSKYYFKGNLVCGIVCYYMSIVKIIFNLFF